MRGTKARVYLFGSQARGTAGMSSDIDIAIDGFFLAIGHKPNTDLFKDFIDLDEQGFIKVVPGTASTNLPGIFAAGDVADPVYRQGIVAAGSGAKAAIEADRYLQQL